jgi:hypothetical protein
MLKQTAIIFSLLTILFSFQCRKSQSEVGKLPPATQTGAETFGCLINGQLFKPKGSSFGGPILSCAYQFINGGYYFQLSAKNKGDILTNVSLHTDSLTIEEGKTYVLEDFFKKGTSSGRYVSGIISTSTEYLTTEVVEASLQ